MLNLIKCVIIKSRVNKTKKPVLPPTRPGPKNGGVSFFKILNVRQYYDMSNTSETPTGSGYLNPSVEKITLKNFDDNNYSEILYKN